MFEFLKQIFGPAAPHPTQLGRPAQAVQTPLKNGNLTVSELCRRLGVSEDQLRGVAISYNRFEIPKRSGGTRTILAPSDELKAMQRTILHRLLRRLEAHPCATGFERGHSIVTNALPHVGQDVVIKLDVKEFFSSTPARRVQAFFGSIGWDANAAALLTRLCTYEDALPQGAPTSPRLSNLVNYRIDARIAGMAQMRNAAYSRYADDITISGPASNDDTRLNDVIYFVKVVLEMEGYALHTEKKLGIYRRHDRQTVTGIVVNVKPNLKRQTRRWLRAVEHRLATTGQSTLTPQQLAGWRALQQMVESQSAAAGG
jgi:RNA-directed DNA polymerase